MDEGYAVMLRLTGRLCVIVGGGAVGARKAVALSATGARITVISPTLEPLLEKMVEEGTINILRQSYSPGILRELLPFLVFAATNHSAINKLIADEAKALNAIVDCTDSSAESDFIGMSTIRRGPITIALSTGGISPALAVHLRERLEQVIGDEYATLASWLAEVRPQIRATPTTQSERAEFWHHIIESPILDNLRHGDEKAARSLFDRFILEATGNST